MKQFSTCLFTLFIVFSLGLGGTQDAEAKRFGGARSFGSRPSYSKPYSRPSNNSQRSATQQKAAQQNQTARNALSRRGGLMGMLGGLALGGLLGSLFFGGAFQGLNLMDMLIFGGIAWLLYKMFLSKPKVRSNEYFYAQDEPYRSGKFTQTSAAQKAGFDTDVLFRNNKSKHSTKHNNDLLDADFDDQPIPDSFDRKAFLEGAKAAYRQLQAAWDKKDLAEIRSLTTDKVFAEIQQQIKSDPNQNHTDILRLDAELLDYRELSSEKETVVLFDSILRENTDQQAKQVKEIWHFIQPTNSSQRTWYLDGIQQMEA